MLCSTDRAEITDDDVELMVAKYLPQSEIFTRDADQSLQLLQRRTFL